MVLEHFVQESLGLLLRSDVDPFIPASPRQLFSELALEEAPPHLIGVAQPCVQQQGIVYGGASHQCDVAAKHPLQMHPDHEAHVLWLQGEAVHDQDLEPLFDRSCKAGIVNHPLDIYLLLYVLAENHQSGMDIYRCTQRLTHDIEHEPLDSGHCDVVSTPCRHASCVPGSGPTSSPAMGSPTHVSETPFVVCGTAWSTVCKPQRSLIHSVASRVRVAIVLQEDPLIPGSRRVGTLPKFLHESQERPSNGWRQTL
mmetsp:Transcript_17814/g.39047  ORF Transcript_17814/g.39047 Transcript_17814/m.39047 type:complete len:254 (-) Transcript_17814:500-1261(-)